MSDKLLARISLFGAIISWALFTFFDMYLLTLRKYGMEVNLSPLWPQGFFTLFVISTFFFYRTKISKAESINFIDLLWRIFITGLLTTIGALIVRFFFIVFKDTAFGQNPAVINFLYHGLTALVVIFLICTLVTWKRFILYQKSKSLLQIWSFFEYALVAALVFDLMSDDIRRTTFNYVLIFVLGFAVVLSFNLKWIAYLNVGQKLKSMLFIVLSGIYLYHFAIILGDLSKTNLLVFDLSNRVFVVSTYLFCFMYAGISVLVTLFNLPTSSVFERKMKEAVDFQKLSQAIPSGQTEEQTYDILLESSMSAVFADAAWLEVRTKDYPNGVFYLKGVTHAQIADIKEQMEEGIIGDIIHFRGNKLIPSNKLTGRIKKGQFKSIMTLPVMTKGNQLGSLVLLQEVGDAFNRELVDIIVTFVNQASISIENFQLLSEAIQNERYLEQLKIAQDVQKSLLPETLVHNDCFEIVAFSNAAEEVGGDYYDITNLDNGKYGLIIADVSGKGTSAAFHMAQMKGIFHTLALPDVPPDQFIRESNRALGACLERRSFITACYFWLDTARRQIQFSRAGHVPALFFSNENKKVNRLEDSGMGLGLLRNNTYDRYVQNKTLPYQSGDVLLLYTDGITEAMNRGGEQYGVKRLTQSLQQLAYSKPLQIKEGIIRDLMLFLDNAKLDDDYTLVIVKFK
jgi:phosphoserine phosphatase RsbU/P